MVVAALSYFQRDRNEKKIVDPKSPCSGCGNPVGKHPIAQNGWYFCEAGCLTRNVDRLKVIRDDTYGWV